jgi:hypothetical protein
MGWGRRTPFEKGFLDFPKLLIIKSRGQANSKYQH